MKRLLLILLLLPLFVSCKNDEEDDEQPNFSEFIKGTWEASSTREEVFDASGKKTEDRTYTSKSTFVFEDAKYTVYQDGIQPNVVPYTIRKDGGKTIIHVDIQQVNTKLDHEIKSLTTTNMTWVHEGPLQMTNPDGTTINGSVKITSEFKR